MSYAIDTIREGYPLISKAFTFSQARFNYGFTTGQITTFFNMRMITLDEWNMVRAESKQAYDSWQGQE